MEGGGCCELPNDKSSREGRLRIMNLIWQFLKRRFVVGRRRNLFVVRGVRRRVLSGVKLMRILVLIRNVKRRRRLKRRSVSVGSVVVRLVFLGSLL